MVIEQLLPTPDAKVVIPALVRVEGRDLLFAFGDEDSGHDWENSAGLGIA
jgi:hypothetical protein